MGRTQTSPSEMRVCPGRYMDGHRHGIMADLKMSPPEEVAKAHRIRLKYFLGKLDEWSGIVTPKGQRWVIPVPSLPSVPNLMVGKKYTIGRWEFDGLPKRVMTFLGTSPSKCAGGELFMFANRADRLETFTIFQLKESFHGEARA